MPNMPASSTEPANGANGEPTSGAATAPVPPISEAALAEHPSPKGLTGELLFLLAGLAALGALATNIILPAFPDMAAALQSSVVDLSATLSSFFVAFAVGQLFVGPLSDRFGRKWLVLTGLVVFVVGSAICALASSMPQLIGGRVVQALGVCATSVLSRAIARDLFNGEALARVLSLIMVAMAAAPGFSPLLGGTLNRWLGWQSTFAFVALLAVVLAVHYVVRLGETQPASLRAPLSVAATLRTYWQLLTDRRFIAPALTVSLVIGSLYAFFGMAPAVLMSGFQFTALELGWFFAATVFVVFGAGMLAPRLARRWGAPQAIRVGIAIALVGGIALWVGPRYLVCFSAALTVVLLGLGVVNPLGTAIALSPFGRQAGAASALLGFMQMGCAATAISLAAALGLPAYVSLGVILTVSLALAFLVFLAQRTR